MERRKGPNSALYKAVLISFLLFGYISAQPDDFGFGDDEDLYDVSGESSGEYATVAPATGVPAMYRATLNITSLAYTPEIAAAGRDLYNLDVTRKLQAAIQSVLARLPGKVRIRIVEYRAGSLLVTFDIDTDGQQSESDILKLLMDAIKSGTLEETTNPSNKFSVSNHGFEFRKSRDETMCPTTVGPLPSNLPNTGNSWANLMVNNAFSCSGFVTSWNYYRKDRGPVIFGVFRQTSPTEYTLIGQTNIPDGPVGVSSLSISPPILARKGDFIGVFYPSETSRGVIAMTTADDGFLPEQSLFQNYYISMFNIEANQAFALSDFVSSENKASFAIQAEMSYENVPEPATIPPPVPCTDDEWRCNNGECIPLNYRCDSQHDCYDGSDEENCPTCQTGEFMCPNTGQCLPREFVCNRIDDCGDNSDELNCGPPAVSIDSFRESREATRFVLSWTPPRETVLSYTVKYRLVTVRADKNADGDFIFEQALTPFNEVTIPGDMNTYALTGLQPFTYYQVEMSARNQAGDSEPKAFIFKTASAGCPPGKWQCVDGGCVELADRCDSIPNCADESDERNCGTGAVCNEGQVACERPDGSYTCVDQNIGCAVRCASNEFPCLDGRRCISFRSLCDGRIDCFDDSDESNCDCAEGEFQCQRGGKCIADFRKCDGTPDCEDASDEVNCPTDCQTELFRGDPAAFSACMSKIAEVFSGLTSISDMCSAEAKEAMKCYLEYIRTCPSIVSTVGGSTGMNLTELAQPGGYDRFCKQYINTSCREGMWQCQDSQCIPERMRCDGTPQCEDGSDEVQCKVACRADQFTCLDGNCVEGRMKCDGVPQCEDQSDEIECDCLQTIILRDAARFTSCSDNLSRAMQRVTSPQDICQEPAKGALNCMLEYIRQCPKIITQSGGGVNLPGGYNITSLARPGAFDRFCEQFNRGCRADQFTCLDGNCVEGRMECDGVPQCEDQSDELNCGCGEGMFECADGNCVKAMMKCDGVPQCEDGSDEFNCPTQPPNCPLTDFQCKTPSLECIDNRLVCDGFSHCSDGSDEQGCPGCSRNEFTCKSDGSCIPESSVCNGQIECRDRSDELDCVCNTTQFRCGDGICIDIRRRCDRRADCQDQSDELACPCPAGEFQCLNGDCIPEARKCDGQPDCSDRSDEQNCPRACPNGYFQCGTGHCLQENRHCDGYPDCPDQSDERDCPLRCASNELTCEPDNRCLGPELICNRVYDCSDGSDELNCQRCSDNEFECESDRSCISEAGRCNGRKECADGSDEMGCPTLPPINILVSPRQLRIRAGMQATITCIANGLPAGASVEWIRNGGELPMQSAVESGKLMIPVAKPMDSGDYTCRVVGVPGSYQDTARLSVEIVGPQTTPEPGVCGRDEAVCQNGQCIPHGYRCDGENDCDDGSDEPASCKTSICEPNEFQCPLGQCVMKIWRCDGEDDCEGGFDEQDCAEKDPNADCGMDEFKCVSGDQCVPLAYQCDKEIDCLDRSDEIGCAAPIVTIPPIQEVEVELGQQFTIRCTAVGVPTPLIVWRLNWGNIPTGDRVVVTSVDGSGQLTISDARYEDAGAYTCEAINNRGSIFAIPDALVIVRLTPEPSPQHIEKTKIFHIWGTRKISIDKDVQMVSMDYDGLCRDDLRLNMNGSMMLVDCDSKDRNIKVDYIGPDVVDYEMFKRTDHVERRGDTLPIPISDTVYIYLGGLPVDLTSNVTETQIIKGISSTASDFTRRTIKFLQGNRNKYRVERQIIYIGVNWRCSGFVELETHKQSSVMQCLPATITDTDKTVVRNVKLKEEIQKKVTSSERETADFRETVDVQLYGQKVIANQQDGSAIFEKDTIGSQSDSQVPFASDTVVNTSDKLDADVRPQENHVVERGFHWSLSVFGTDSVIFDKVSHDMLVFNNDRCMDAIELTLDGDKIIAKCGSVMGQVEIQLQSHDGIAISFARTIVPVKKRSGKGPLMPKDIILLHVGGLPVGLLNQDHEIHTFKMPSEAVINVPFTDAPDISDQMQQLIHIGININCIGYLKLVDVASLVRKKTLKCLMDFDNNIEQSNDLNKEIVEMPYPVKVYDDINALDKHVHSILGLSFNNSKNSEGGFKPTFNDLRYEINEGHKGFYDPSEDSNDFEVAWSMFVLGTENTTLQKEGSIILGFEKLCQTDLDINVIDSKLSVECASNNNKIVLRYDGKEQVNFDFIKSLVTIEKRGDVLPDGLSINDEIHLFVGDIPKNISLTGNTSRLQINEQTSSGSSKHKMQGPHRNPKLDEKQIMFLSFNKECEGYLSLVRNHSQQILQCLKRASTNPAVIRQEGSHIENSDLIEIDVSKSSVSGTRNENEIMNEVDHSTQQYSEPGIVVTKPDGTFERVFLNSREHTLKSDVDWSIKITGAKNAAYSTDKKQLLQISYEGLCQEDLILKMIGSRFLTDCRMKEGRLELEYLGHNVVDYDILKEIVTVERRGDTVPDATDDAVIVHVGGLPANVFHSVSEFQSLKGIGSPVLADAKRLIKFKGKSRNSTREEKQIIHLGVKKLCAGRLQLEKIGNHSFLHCLKLSAGDKTGITDEIVNLDVVENHGTTKSELIEVDIEETDQTDAVTEKIVNLTIFEKPKVIKPELIEVDIEHVNNKDIKDTSPAPAIAEPHVITLVETGGKGPLGSQEVHVFGGGQTDGHLTGDIIEIAGSIHVQVNNNDKYVAAGLGTDCGAHLQMKIINGSIIETLCHDKTVSVAYIGQYATDIVISKTLVTLEEVGAGHLYKNEDLLMIYTGGIPSTLLEGRDDLFIIEGITRRPSIKTEEHIVITGGRTDNIGQSQRKQQVVLIGISSQCHETLTAKVNHGTEIIECIETEYRNETEIIIHGNAPEVKPDSSHAVESLSPTIEEQFNELQVGETGAIDIDSDTASVQVLEKVLQIDTINEVFVRPDKIEVNLGLNKCRGFNYEVVSYGNQVCVLCNEHPLVNISYLQETPIDIYVARVEYPSLQSQDIDTMSSTNDELNIYLGSNIPILFDDQMIFEVIHNVSLSNKSFSKRQITFGKSAANVERRIIEIGFTAGCKSGYEEHVFNGNIFIHCEKGNEVTKSETTLVLHGSPGNNRESSGYVVYTGESGRHETNTTIIITGGPDEDETVTNIAVNALDSESDSEETSGTGEGDVTHDEDLTVFNNFDVKDHDIKTDILSTNFPRVEKESTNTNIDPSSVQNKMTTNSMFVTHTERARGEMSDHTDIRVSKTSTEKSPSATPYIHLYSINQVEKVNNEVNVVHKTKHNQRKDNLQHDKRLPDVNKKPCKTKTIIAGKGSDNEEATVTKIVKNITTILHIPPPCEEETETKVLVGKSGGINNTVVVEKVENKTVIIHSKLEKKNKTVIIAGKASDPPGVVVEKVENKTVIIHSKPEKKNETVIIAGKASDPPIVAVEKVENKTVIIHSKPEKKNKTVIIAGKASEQDKVVNTRVEETAVVFQVKNEAPNRTIILSGKGPESDKSVISEETHTKTVIANFTSQEKENNTVVLTGRGKEEILTNKSVVVEKHVDIAIHKQDITTAKTTPVTTELPSVKINLYGTHVNSTDKKDVVNIEKNNSIHQSPREEHRVFLIGKATYVNLNKMDQSVKADFGSKCPNDYELFRDGRTVQIKCVDSDQVVNIVFNESTSTNVHVRGTLRREHNVPQEGSSDIVYINLFGIRQRGENMKNDEYFSINVNDLNKSSHIVHNSHSNNSDEISVLDIVLDTKCVNGTVKLSSDPNWQSVYCVMNNEASQRVEETKQAVAEETKPDLVIMAGQKTRVTDTDDNTEKADSAFDGQFVNSKNGLDTETLSVRAYTERIRPLEQTTQPKAPQHKEDVSKYMKVIGPRNPLTQSAFPSTQSVIQGGHLPTAFTGNQNDQRSITNPLLSSSLIQRVKTSLKPMDIPLNEITDIDIGNNCRATVEAVEGKHGLVIKFSVGNETVEMKLQGFARIQQDQSSEEQGSQPVAQQLGSVLTGPRWQRAGPDNLIQTRKVSMRGHGAHSGKEMSVYEILFAGRRKMTSGLNGATVQQLDHLPVPSQISPIVHAEFIDIENVQNTDQSSHIGTSMNPAKTTSNVRRGDILETEDYLDKSFPESGYQDFDDVRFREMFTEVQMPHGRKRRDAAFEKSKHDMNMRHVVSAYEFKPKPDSNFHDEMARFASSLGHQLENLKIEMNKVGDVKRGNRKGMHGRVKKVGQSDNSVVDSNIKDVRGQENVVLNFKPGLYGPSKHGSTVKHKPQPLHSVLHRGRQHHKFNGQQRHAGKGTLHGMTKMSKNMDAFLEVHDRLHGVKDKRWLESKTFLQNDQSADTTADYTGVRHTQTRSDVGKQQKSQLRSGVTGFHHRIHEDVQIENLDLQVHSGFENDGGVKMKILLPSPDERMFGSALSPTLQHWTSSIGSGQKGPCNPPFFNSLALSSDECVRCFCFGQSIQCFSSSLQVSRIALANELSLVQRTDRTIKPIEQRYVDFKANTREYQVLDMNRALPQGSYYWSLPQEFLGEKLKSYGGEIKYTAFYRTQSRRPQETNDPDIIISGNGITLFYRGRTLPSSGVPTSLSAPLIESAWEKSEGPIRGDTPVSQYATRGDLMTVLQNLESVIIRASYERSQVVSRIGGIFMTTAVDYPTEFGQAALVEECTCPTGYTGLSCQGCAAGFSRVQTGPYLGQCVACNCNGHSNDCDPYNGQCLNCQHNTYGANCQVCIDGYYGDPRRGTPSDCQACPCPLTDRANQFTRSCYLHTDNQVTCANCPVGYEGRRCERCSEGYVGDPMTPGSSCVKKNIEEYCDPRGSLSPQPNPVTRRCECKENVAGDKCDSCKKDTFYLSSNYDSGCFRCFCMGVSNTCQSTSWNRAQVGLTFAREGEEAEFKVVNLNGEQVADQRFRVNTGNRELIFRFGGQVPVGDDSVYFALPSRFTGNKLTSYGGSLRFSATYSTRSRAALRENEPFVVLVGNDITLVHRVTDDIQANKAQAFNILMFEQYWQRIDGMPATREHLLMTLADLDSLLIRASYDESQIDSRLQDISMDIAEERQTRQDRAYAVEQCVCRVGHRGLSCEDCDTGYTRSGRGLYLGLCEPCNCNGHSGECDPETGVCRNCQHNTQGDNCERCAVGFYGDALRGTRNDCQKCPCPLTESPNQFSPSCKVDTDGQVTCTSCPTGHTGRRCETCLTGYSGNPLKIGDYCKLGPGDQCDCDSRGTVPNTQCADRQCQCKPYTQGRQCSRCREGHFYLEASNPQGCLTCFCSGITNQCTSSDYHRDAIRPQFRGDGSHNFVLMNRRMNSIISDGFIVDAARNSITFNGFDGVQKERESLFFQLPPKFRGDQVSAYGGYLRFTLEFSARRDGRLYRDVDMEIISDGQQLRLYYLFEPSLQEEKSHTYEILLRESSFTDSRINTAPTRETLMNILSNVDGILIRATYSTKMASVTLRDVSMDTAVATPTNLGGAKMVEDCRCPEGYTGLSCERCDQGYLRVSERGTVGRCVRCNCNGHAQSCDPETGRCLECQHNTEGDRCERCATGFYGDATSGTPNDCRACACPLTTSPNQFSRSCFLAEDNKVTCDRCPTGYTGRNCGQCAPGYVGNPTELGGSCRPSEEDLRPDVKVSPTRVDERERSTAIFQCSVSGRGPFNVVWSRLDSRPLPDRASVSPRYDLTLRNLARDDSGRYICTATNAYGVTRREVELVVIHGETPITVRVDQTKLEIDEGEMARFVCSVYSSSRGTTSILSWSRQGGSIASKAIEQNGVLVIPNVESSDAGTYVCMGSDMFTMDEVTVTLVVKKADNDPPTVRIEPRYQTVEEGKRVRFNCVATGGSPKIEWHRGSRQMSPEATISRDGTLIIPRARIEDEADYYCKATNDYGTTEVRTILYVTKVTKPTITVIVRRQKVVAVAGQTAELECYMQDEEGRITLFWSRQNNILPAGSSQDNGVLTIPNVQPAYAGKYVCTGTDDTGRVGTATTVLEVNAEPQTVAPKAIVEPEELTIPMGTTGTLRCSATGTPQPTVKWIKSRSDLSPNHKVTGNVLRIHNATMEDRGIYVCRVENVAGLDQDWAVVEVERRMRPKIDVYPNMTQEVPVGGSAIFQCRVMDGQPPPTVEWKRVGGLPMPADKIEIMQNNVIMFKQATQEEQGSYTCTATNEMGSTSATITLVVQGPPSIVISPSKVVTAVIGQRVTLECTATGQPTPVVYWIEPRQNRRGDLPVLESGYPESPGSAVLDIARVATDDEGYYKCVARNDGGQTEDTVQLIVRAGESQGVKISGPSTLAVVEGQSVELVCSADAIRNARITWRRREGRLPPGHYVSNGVLTLPRFRSEYAGEYICSTLTQTSKFEASVFIIVTVAPRVTLSPQKITSRAGDTIQLRCTASGSGPFNIEWSKVEGQMNPQATERDGILEIRQISAADAGQYRCVVQSSAGTSDGYAIVQVQVPPTISVGRREITSEVGVTAELRCDVGGSPRPVIRWEKESGPLPPQHRIENGVLTIINVQPEDAGRYICTATSSAGNARDYAVLNVNKGSMIDPNTAGVDTQVVDVGDRVTMECIVTGTPLPTITWSRDDGPLPQGAIVGDGILIIPQARMEDAGTYTCLAVNEAGSLSSKVILYVRVNASNLPEFGNDTQPQISAPSEMSAALGSSVSLVCDASGFPSPDITWYRKEGSMPNDYTILDGNLFISRVRPEDAGTYVCHAENQHGGSDTPVRLSVGDLVPYFNQDPNSYMAFAPLNDVYVDFDILLHLKPESSEGLVLYNGQFEDGGGDFVCFGLKEGYPEFRFDVGSGPAVIRGNRTLPLNEWHTIKLTRDRKQGSMVVNNEPAYVGESPGAFTGLDLEQNMYLGSVPNYDNIPRLTSFREGFVGTVSDVQIKGISMNLGAEALEIVGVDSSDVCSQQAFCGNGATCVPANVQYGVTCFCPQGFYGPRCTERGERCYQGACGESGRCYNLEGGLGFKCVCPVGRTGPGCQKDIEIINPAFDRTSFIAYPPVRDGLFSLKTYIEFKSKSLSDGIIMYNGHRKDGREDFMALIQKDGYLEFRFDTGSGPAIIRSRNPLRQGEWTRVTTSTRQHVGTLVVNNEPPVTVESGRWNGYVNDQAIGRRFHSYQHYKRTRSRNRRGASPGGNSTIGLNLQLPFYIGGTDPSHTVSPGAAVNTGFIGCIGELEINSRKVDLMNDAIESYNIRDCGERRLCARQPCENNGICEDLPGPDYRCLCASPYTGKNCDVEINICLTNNPCQAGAPCSITNTGYRCDCPLGRAGMDCEQAIDLGSNLRLLGDGFIEFSKDLLPHAQGQERQVVSLKIRTTQSDGIIFWQGEPGGRPLQGGDYFAIGLKKGYVEFSYEMGSGAAVITSRVRVNDGQTHTITTERLGRMGSLIVDNDGAVSGESQGFLQVLNADGNIFVGGVSMLELMTDGKYTQNFEGCITDLVVNSKGPLQASDAITGYNIQSCSP